MMDNELTPREIVEALDKYIIAQEDAKRAVAIALRNRVRRREIPDDLKDEVIPKNILMIGPTGVGKTEIARRLANLANAPFIKVEATKFTEVGYVGRDVESMIRDLTDNAYRMVEEEFKQGVQEEARQRAEERLIDALAGARTDTTDEQMTQTPEFMPQSSDMTEQEAQQRQQWVQQQRQQEDRVRQFTEQRLKNGELEDEEVEIESQEDNWQTMQVFSGAGLEEMGFNMQDMLGNMLPSKQTTKTMKVKDARRVLQQQEAQKLVDEQEVAEEALRRVEENSIVFLDEIDKIAGREATQQSPDVSREGVQRDILPVIEGSTVTTKYGPVKTNHVLFIAAGAFHATNPSDLIPELQGRFPLRVELKSLTRDDFCRILTEPENSLIRQYTALLKTEDVNLEFTDDAIDQIADLATEVNEGTENIGARRLYTLMEKLLDDISFEAPETDQSALQIDAEYVNEHLAEVVEDRDLTRYML